MIENYHRYVHLRMKHVVRNKYIVQKWMFFQTLIVLLFDFEISNWNRQKNYTKTDCNEWFSLSNCWFWTLVRSYCSKFKLCLACLRLDKWVTLRSSIWHTLFVSDDYQQIYLNLVGLWRFWPLYHHKPRYIYMSIVNQLDFCRLKVI